MMALVGDGKGRTLMEDGGGNRYWVKIPTHMVFDPIKHPETGAMLQPVEETVIVPPRDISVRGRDRVPGETWVKPLLSDAAGVHAEQVPEARELYKGVCEFTDDGRAVFKDQIHRRKALKRFGMHDNDSFD